MDKAQTLHYLKDKGIPYEITEHKAVFHMDELDAEDLPYPGADAKNLFVRDDKRRQFYLISVKGDKPVDLKEFRRQYGTKPLTFASPEELAEILELIPGAVTPLGLLNDVEHRVAFYLDEDFLEDPGIIGCHPNDNTATVWLKSNDLLSLLEESGTPVHMGSIPLRIPARQE